MLPTISVIIKGQVADHIVGFDDMGGEDQFATDALASRLAAAGVLAWEGGDYVHGQGAQKVEGKGYVGHQRRKGDSSDEDSD